MDTLFTGTMDFETELAFNSGNTMFESMDGFINLEGYDLILYGFDVDDVLKKFEKSQRFNLIDVGALFLAGPVGPVVSPMIVARSRCFRLYVNSSAPEKVRLLVST